MNRNQRRKTVNVDTTDLERAIERAEKGKIKVERKTLQNFLDNLDNDGVARKPKGKSVSEVMAEAEKKQLVNKVTNGLKNKKKP